MPLDGKYYPFTSMAGYSSMAPCMRTCDRYSASFNGCDNFNCWCNVGNLNIRMNSLSGCAASECTFQNMNTATDMSRISGIQLTYCSERGIVVGAALPTSVNPQTTATAIMTTGGGFVATQTNLFSQPTETGGSTSTTTNSSDPITTVSNGLGLAAKIGIAVGAGLLFLALVLIITYCVRRRRPRQVIIQQPPMNHPSYPPPGYMPPTPMQQPNYPQNTGLLPPPINTNMPQKTVAAYATPVASGGDISPIEQGTPVPARGIVRKEVPAKKIDISPVSTPAPSAVSPIASPPPLPTGTPANARSNTNTRNEVHGSIPPPRHEMPIDGEITNSASAHGMEMDASQQRQHTQLPMNHYPSSQQGYSQEGQWTYKQYNPPPSHHQAQEMYSSQRAQEMRGSPPVRPYEMQGSQAQGEWRQGMPGQGMQMDQQTQQQLRGPPSSGPYEIGPGR